MPVPLVGRDPYRVASAHPLRGLAFLADESRARRDLEQLPGLMLMPDRPPVRREYDGADVHTVGLREDRIEPHLAGGRLVQFRRQDLGVASRDQLQSGTSLRVVHQPK